MNEKLLHFVWQCQEFDKRNLVSREGQSLVILSQGILNSNEGPDFSQGRVRIGDLEWHGPVEIHIKSSEWRRHGHQQHPAYDQVILHVVWQDDQPVVMNSGELLPTLELQGRVKPELLLKYQKLAHQRLKIPCEKFFSRVPDVVKRGMIDASAVERMETKCLAFEKFLRSTQNDWDLATCQFLVANFGFKTNQPAFADLSARLPISLIPRLANLHQVEALVFGTAGMLTGKKMDPYGQQLLAEYRFLAVKFELTQNQLKPGVWKFLRLRPSNFPSLRLAQLSAILFSNQRFFSTFKESQTLLDLMKCFRSVQSTYWREHYDFGLASPRPLSGVGEQSQRYLVINVVLPMLLAYARVMDQPSWQEKALNLLQELPGEDNSVIRNWLDLGVKVESALDSQGLIGLFNNYCQNRNCLSCKIGASFLRNDSNRPD